MSPLLRGDPHRATRLATLGDFVGPLHARVRGPELSRLADEPGLELLDRAAAAAALVTAARRALAERVRISDRAEALRTTWAAADPSERRTVLVRHLQATVPHLARRRADIAATRRDLDLDCLLEREAAEADLRGTIVELVARALGGLFAHWWADPGASAEAALAGLEHSGALDLVAGLAEREDRLPTRRAAVQALVEILSAALSARATIAPAGLRLLRRLVRDPTEDPWIRRAALRVAPGLPPPIAHHWLEEASSDRRGPHAFLLRAAAADMRLAVGAAWSAEQILPLVSDESELVRSVVVCGLAGHLGAGSPGAAALLERILRHDPDPQIRSLAADHLGDAGPAGLELLGVCIQDVPQVARYALEATIRAARHGRALPTSLHHGLTRVRATAPPAEAHLAALALACERAAAAPASTIATRLAALRPGRTDRVHLPADLCTLDLAEALLPHTFDGTGFQLEPEGDAHAPGVRVRVRRGERRTPTAWRTLHELRHPAPAKRSGHDHTVGVADDGTVRVPPFLFAEETATGVPGERHLLRRPGGWLPALPMVHDYLHAARSGPITLVTGDGRTTIAPPPGRWSRLRAWAHLTWNFGRLDRLRSSAAESAEPEGQGAYVRELDGLGFHTLHEGESSPSATHFRSAVDPIAFAVSLSSSSLFHLALVVALLGGLLFGRLAWSLRTLRRARATIPLVIGGWGTRGKSGTERLKAALFESLGVPFLSKTTGCEAMVLHAPPGGRAHELFLFRPYDKASVWEQVDVVHLAGRLGVRSLLWECMALNPSFVQLLQNWWMRDDISTLTNAYPDHEDIQGPTGLDVAEVIGGFAPPGGTLFTTERSMFPVLQEQAARRQTQVHPLRRATAELVPRDLLELFPHAEHPANIALVAAVAESLGVPRTEAIGLMATHVVPDVGALQLYPEATVDGRRVVFANGMSANDTLSFRHNWRKVGFDAVDHTAKPDAWIVTVVNNRADRVARSQVFARILAEDAPAHRHVLIGTNVRGLARYFAEEAASVADGASLDGRPGQVDALFAHLRIADAGALGDACAAALGAPAPARAAWRQAVALASLETASWPQARQAAERLRPAARTLAAACPESRDLAPHLVEAVARHLALAAARRAPQSRVRDLYRALAMASLHIVDDPHCPGDLSMHHAISAAPPGAHVRILGAQNIKGTGLDFAYQWTYWRELHAALAQIGDPDPLVHHSALAAVGSNPLGSVLACEAAADVLTDPTRVDTADPAIRGMVAYIEERRRALLAARRQAGERRHGWRGRILGPLERLVDPLDSVWRRYRASQIMRDLGRARISHGRAQVALRTLVSRQKGGWLTARRHHEPVAAPVPAGPPSYQGRSSTETGPESPFRARI